MMGFEIYKNIATKNKDTKQLEQFIVYKKLHKY